MKRRAFLGAALLGTMPPALATPFAAVVPGRALAFPADHASHPEFRNEWWYVTGVVRDGAGRELGVQVTFFRNRPGVAESSASRFAPNQLILAHAAIAETAHGRLHHDQRVERVAFDLAGADVSATRVWVRDWSLHLDGDTYVARIAASGFAIDLRFRATAPMLIQGDGGFSRKGPLATQASHYYSRPQLEVTGRLAIGGSARDVSGRAWLDHEWSSEVMGDDAVGWDWIGVNMVDGGALMAFRMRDRRGGAVWAGGARRVAGRADEIFAPEDVRFSARRQWTSPRTSLSYPVEFDVHAKGIDYTVSPLMDDQELDARRTTGNVYWEGAVRATRNGVAVGSGYLELTGYGSPLKI